MFNDKYQNEINVFSQDTQQTLKDILKTIDNHANLSKSVALSDTETRLISDKIKTILKQNLN